MNEFKKQNNYDKSITFGEDNSERRMKQSLDNDRIDEKFGFKRISDFKERIGFMINMHVTEVLDENKRLVSAVDYYFLKEDGKRFKATVTFQPYFFVLAKSEVLRDVASFITKKYDGIVTKVDVVAKEDLDLPNHLVGLKQRYLKLSFACITDLMKVRRDVLAAVRKAREKTKAKTMYSEMLTTVMNIPGKNKEARKCVDHFESILDIREYDVPYHIRVSIDLRLFAGAWYSVVGRGTECPIITRRHDLVETPDLIVLAFDIECTKQPLKFPDAACDQIMMISYMIDGQGYLVNNREVISADVEDFEYTPHPEFEGNFIIHNEPNEKAVLERFFEHICDIKPNVIVTYNGDSFDWPFVEQRAKSHQLDMALEIGFSLGKDTSYLCRPMIHMDCLWWVKRDSYLPVGSQNLKAVAKAKLRYDPVEIDPEDMCRMAAEEPQTMCNYSVSDAVATYYLYMKYVHPFIFALCTILPMEPDEVLRKGSGTLCETLLMVEAFHANIIFPNKQEQELNKITPDGHVLESETYVGGHVEALESGVFRADLPCRFKLVPEAFDTLIAGVRRAMTHAIEEEEKVPLNLVTNMDEIVQEIEGSLAALREKPIRVEPPVIIHLDVGAMYPNIILTNRLQPSAVVDEEACGACDFNRPGATCQRKMNWVWRGECMPASRGEFQRIQQQLELEKFRSDIPNAPPRAFHQLSREEAAAIEKKRLIEYCRKAYKKAHITRIETKVTTICQKENSFYVDTVRAFRDRRYEYKGLCKDAKRAVSEAVTGGDARKIKSAKNREVLYDSLQLAHKCILNSFYGYVMRRGARWHSMEMAGIVCHTGAGIIKKARELIEQVGRPLELDTDGIWCILPESFPQTFTILTNHEKKKKLSISYPNAVLNCMVKEDFTNHVYHELKDAATLKYEVRSENTIFFEVDGPYLAMILPASKEEGKKLKKRYAVFNFDKSLAELKGFEVKRRGELQLIKIFQSSVFEAFLKGETLEKCYEAVAKVADYWLDVLYSKAYNLPDCELFDLVSEKKSMSRKLEDYGAQKSTSISTAKRLAEFLGDQMVKDKGLACRFIISKRPEGSPVTERAIPLAIFQSEPSLKRHYLRKWLKDASLTDIDIRQVLDWNYYIERLNGAIQKIITIPAALQGLSNPVPRVRHPDWLHKKMLEKSDVLKQRKMNEFFKKGPKPAIEPGNTNAVDMEDISGKMNPPTAGKAIVKRKRKRGTSDFTEDELALPWRDVLGPSPPFGKTREEHIVWLQYHKKKWVLQLEQKKQRCDGGVRKKGPAAQGAAPVMRNTGTIAGFIKKAQRTILVCPWQVIQFAETNEPGLYRVWALVERELHVLKLTVPRTFYVHQRTQREEPPEGACWKRAIRQLPRSQPLHYLYEYSVPEDHFQEHEQELLTDLTSPDIEGIYEKEVPLEFRILVKLGCSCAVDRAVVHKMEREGMRDSDTFSLNQLNSIGLDKKPYLEKLSDGTSALKQLFLYQHHSVNSQRAIYAVFSPPSRKAVVYVLDSVRTNQMPNLQQIFQAEMKERADNGVQGDELPPAEIQFEVQVLTDVKQLHRALQRFIHTYREEKHGPTMIILQSAIEPVNMVAAMPGLTDFPIVRLHEHDSLSLYSTLEWQRAGAKKMIEHYVNMIPRFNQHLNQCRYFHIPVGNLPADVTLFGADLFFAKHLLKNNFVLWCSPSPLPDLGGKQADDSRLLTEIEDVGSCVVNAEGAYSSVCVELQIDHLAVNTILQSHHVHDVEGTTSSVAFDAAPQGTVEKMIGAANDFASYDESALSRPAFRVLRALVSSWMQRIFTQRNPFADQQIIHFYRWLRSPSSLLYDPALVRTVHGLMKKLFVQLVAEIRRLGSSVIYADFSRIIICSRKQTVADALGYVDYLLASVGNKELFHGIIITKRYCWEYMLWLDSANYCGFLGKLSDTDNTMTSPTEEAEEEDGCIPDGHWDIAKVLPEEMRIRENFTSIILAYMEKIWQRLREQVRSQLANASPQRRGTPGAFSQITATPMGVGIDETLKEFVVELVEGPLSQRLFSMVQQIHRKLPTAKTTALGMEGRIITPALEFSKAITRVLALDAAIKEPVAKMRRNMLKLIGIGEFSNEAVWREHCLTVILPGVMCGNCNCCRDINLCKDPHCVEVDGRLLWSCPEPTCENIYYDPEKIEHQLIDTVNRKVLSYTLQDLQCTKCQEIQIDNLTDHCTCAGQYSTLVSSSNLISYLTTLECVAKTFQMPLLLYAVTSLLAFNQP